MRGQSALRHKKNWRKLGRVGFSGTALKELMRAPFKGDMEIEFKREAWASRRRKERKEESVRSCWLVMVP